MNDQEQLVHISSILKETKSTGPSTTKTDEEYLSMARKVMNIVAREKKFSEND